MVKRVAQVMYCHHPVHQSERVPPPCPSSLTLSPAVLTAQVSKKKEREKGKERKKNQRAEDEKENIPVVVKQTIWVYNYN